MKNTLVTPRILSILLLCFACDKGGGLGADDAFIPDFSNEWQVTKGSYDGFIFVNPTVTDSAKGTGILEGNNQGAAVTLLVAGTFVNTRLSITITSDSLNPGNPPISDSTFTGIFDTLANPHAWRLTNSAPPHDSLVLVRN